MMICDPKGRGLQCVLVLIALLAWAPGVDAYPIKLGGDVTLDIAGHDRVFYTYLTSFPLDETGLSVGDPGSGKIHHRLRLSPSLSIGKTWKFFGQIDFLYYDSVYNFDTTVGAGAAASFPSPLRDQAEGFRPVDPRQLYLSWRSPIGLVRFGQMSSNWGLGIIANNGDRQTGEFAAPRFGDLVERLVLATPILRLFGNSPILNRILLVAGVDLVFRDENAELIKGDTAFQGVFSLLYRQPKKVFVGVYFAIRSQQDREQRSRLEARLLDFFMRLRTSFIDGSMEFEIATEGAFLFGFTDRILTDEALNGVELWAGAIVGRLGLRFPKAGLRFGLEVGFASGDNDPADGTSRLFRFDPDYQPSLILFRHVLPAVTAHGADRAIDPDRVGLPPPGSDQLPSWGQIGNTLYTQLVAAWHPFHNMGKALRGLELKVGLTYARAVADLADPYNTFRAGGVNTTHFNLTAEDRKDLGFEINASLTYQYVFTQSVKIRLMLLYGHFFPGNAFEQSDGKTTPIDMFQARLKASF